MTYKTYSLIHLDLVHFCNVTFAKQTIISYHFFTNMSALESDISYNTTAASSQLDGGNNVEVIKVKNYAKELLKSRIFLGRYMERRLCDPRIGYRDIVLVSPAEVDLKRDLTEVQDKLRSVSPSTHWIGITDGEVIGYSGLCLWTEIDNQPFGPFWFQIRSIKFRDVEVIITVKCLRHITESFLEIEPILTGSVKRKSTAVPKPGEPDCITSSEVLNENWKEIVQTLKSALSIRNVKEFVTFLCAFVIAVFTGSSALINFLGNFILALIREMSLLIRNSTPLFLGFLEFLSKLVGGFYLLLAMLFRQNSPVPIDRRSIKYQDRTNRSRRVSSSYDYDHTSFD